MKGIDPIWLIILGVIVTVDQGIGQGAVSLTNMFPAGWAPHIQAWCGFIGIVGTAVMSAMSLYSSNKAGPLVSAPAVPPVVKVAIGFLIVGVALAFAAPAMAAQKRPTFTGNPLVDIRNIGTAAGQAAQATTPGGTPTCGFGTFTALTPDNLVSLLQACASKMLAGSQGALASAGKANDNIATACLTPAVALLQAAIGTPAVAAVDAVPATATTSAAPATPAVAAQLPDPILMFQKFREFVNAGGITNCKAWINNTVTAATASGL